MPAPWTTSVKDIDLSNSTKHSNHKVPVSAGFRPPALVTRLQCSPQALFAAIAKMQALRTASPAIVAVLQRSAAALIEAIVDDAGSRFDLTPEADMLESTIRGALSGSVGAGLCHLYMMALGYVWNDFAASVISTTSPLADFAYDGGPAQGHGLVLAEAKGSFSNKVDAAYVESEADSGYTKQVDRHIAAPTKNGSAKVVHGYAIAFGAKPEPIRQTTNPPHAMLHVAETDAKVAAAPTGGGTGDDTMAANGVLALGNYRADFMLAQAPLVVDTIDWLRTGAAPLEPREQLFVSTSARGRKFLIGQSEGRRDDWGYRDFPSRLGHFAVELTVAREFLNELTNMARRWEPGGVEPRVVDSLKLPVLSSRLDGGGEGEAAWFPDGLALLAKIERDKQLLWSPYEGLRPL